MQGYVTTYIDKVSNKFKTFTQDSFENALLITKTCCNNSVALKTDEFYFETRLQQTERKNRVELSQVKGKH